MKEHEAVDHCRAAIEACVREATADAVRHREVWRKAASERLDRIILYEDILADCWAQFSCDMEDGLMSDGALSTLEAVARILLSAKRLERHPEKQWYRFPATVAPATADHAPAPDRCLSERMGLGTDLGRGDGGSTKETTC